ncbi:MAG: hypothetical protein WBF90_20575 [Rivularia sp. (in: cyanobacteria)]|jgi:iron uptake system component EfeO
MKTILRLFGLGLAGLCLVFLTNCAQSSDIATNTDTATATNVAATSSDYSEQVQAGIQYFQKQAQERSINAQQRDAIVDAAYNYVDALTKARNSLGIEA